jgi:hypothetical protein
VQVSGSAMHHLVAHECCSLASVLPLSILVQLFLQYSNVAMLCHKGRVCLPLHCLSRTSACFVMEMPLYEHLTTSPEVILVAGGPWQSRACVHVRASACGLCARVSFVGIRFKSVCRFVPARVRVSLFPLSSGTCPATNSACSSG